jgi:hypothetical protein
MPPSKPSFVLGKVYDTGDNLVEGATISLVHSSGTITALSNSSGEYILNLGDLSSWESGDSASVTASKTKKGTTTSTIVLVAGNNSLDFYLLETSDLSFPIQMQDRYNLNFALLTDYAGNKITADNPLPVKFSYNPDFDLANNYETTWTITRSDGQPDYEEVTFKGDTYRRTFTYTNNILTKRSKWEKQ